MLGHILNDLAEQAYLAFINKRPAEYGSKRFSELTATERETFRAVARAVVQHSVKAARHIKGAPNA